LFESLIEDYLSIIYLHVQKKDPTKLIVRSG